MTFFLSTRWCRHKANKAVMKAGDSLCPIFSCQTQRTGLLSSNRIFKQNNSSHPPLVDSMSKVRGKKGQRRKVIFFNEMWKIIRQIDDFGLFWTLWGVFSQKLKIPKNDCFEKVKILRFFLKDWITYFKYNIYHSYSKNFMI